MYDDDVHDLVIFISKNNRKKKEGKYMISIL